MLKKLMSIIVGLMLYGKPIRMGKYLQNKYNKRLNFLEKVD